MSNFTHNKHVHKNNSCVISSWLTYYHLTIKLWEGNVFSRVCLSTGGRSHIAITNDALYLTIHGPLAIVPPPFVQGPLSPTPSLLDKLVAKTEDLFKFVHLRTPLVLTPDGWLLNHIWWATGRMQPTGMLSCFI